MIDEGDHYYQKVTSIERSRAVGRSENPEGVFLLEILAFIFHDFSSKSATFDQFDRKLVTRLVMLKYSVPLS